MPIRQYRQTERGNILNWPFKFVVLFLLALVINGCAPSIQFGKPPMTDRLDTLKIDVSTKQDIKAVLGEPQGYGAVRSPSFGIKEAWLYESTDVEGSKARLRMLMVFLDKERGVYHGHLWFASGMLLGQTK
jgi:hypothetical protein